jgi:hypothetical protein
MVRAGIYGGDSGFFPQRSLVHAIACLQHTNNNAHVFCSWSTRQDDGALRAFLVRGTTVERAFQMRGEERPFQKAHGFPKPE